jgi:hypothetical protein
MPRNDAFNVVSHKIFQPQSFQKREEKHHPRNTLSPSNNIGRDLASEATEMAVS